MRKFGRSFDLRAVIPAIAIVALTLIPAATAQTVTATVRGTVTDSTGAVVPNARVTATNQSTGVATSTTTNQAGAYNIQFLPIGPYTITATSQGFETSSIGPFNLEIDQIAKVDAVLKVGSTATTVRVSTEAPLLQTQDETLGATLPGETLVSLPMNGLNFQFATLFVPGAVDPSLAYMDGADGNERDTDWYGSPSFNGNRGQANNYVWTALR
jgi:hypothetical protein